VYTALYIDKCINSRPGRRLSLTPTHRCTAATYHRPATSTPPCSALASPGADVDNGEPSPGADVGGASPVPAQLVYSCRCGQGRVQSPCRCGQGRAQSGRSLSSFGAMCEGVGGERAREGGAGMSATTGHPAEVVAHARQLVRWHSRRPRARVPALTPSTPLAPSDVRAVRKLPRLQRKPPGTPAAEGRGRRAAHRRSSCALSFG
jgi:hypothetical protein